MTPIDFVIPWVDGADPVWRKKMKSFHPGREVDASIARYRDWGLLKYWFRGVERYAPWVRSIFLITDQQCPVWLNTAHPKLRLVDHRDYIPSSYLPTFSANPIELNVHRIEGLAEQFVYFNDDVFLLRPAKREDFFRGGIPCDAAVFSPVIVSGWEGVGSAGCMVANDLCVINQNFTKSGVVRSHFLKFYNIRYGCSLLRTLFLSPWRHLVGFQNHHVSQSFLKKTFEQVWEAEPRILHETCTHRFRNYRLDVNQWLMRYWQFVSGSFVPVSPRMWKNLPIVKMKKTLRGIERQKYQRVSINDVDIENFEEARGAVAAAFHSILPQKSEFER